MLATGSSELLLLLTNLGLLSGIRRKVRMQYHQRLGKTTIWNVLTKTMGWSHKLLCKVHHSRNTSSSKTLRYQYAGVLWVYTSTRRKFKVVSGSILVVFMLSVSMLGYQDNEVWYCDEAGFNLHVSSNY